MSIKRRGLWAILTGAPAAAIGIVAAPAKAEPVHIIVTIDDSKYRDIVRVIARDAAERVVPAEMGKHAAQGAGDWRS